MRPAYSLPELLLALALVAIVSVVAVPRFNGMRDRLAVTAAANDLHALLDAARAQAWLRNSRTTVVLDSASGVARLMAAADTLQVRALTRTHGVSLWYSQDSIGYSPHVMGYGASNSTVVMRRGAQTESLHVSRLGRVRR